MENCFLCKTEAYKCEMSVYRPYGAGTELKELICADCRHKDTPSFEGGEDVLDMGLHREKVQALFEEEKYKEVCDYVDGLYGWKPGELTRVYNREAALFCLKQL